MIWIWFLKFWSFQALSSDKRYYRPDTLVEYSRKDNSHVMTVGISAVNIRNSIQKKRKLVLFITLVASLPIPRYNRPIRIPTVKWEINRNLVNVCKEKGKKLYLLVPCFYYLHCLTSLYYMCWFFFEEKSISHLHWIWGKISNNFSFVHAITWSKH